MLTDVFANLGAPGTDASLTEVECLEVLACAPCLLGGWCVQRDEDDRGHISLGILCEDGGAHETVFVLWREEGRLQLGLAHGERYFSLGVHASMASALKVMQAAIGGGGPGRFTG